MLVTSRKKKVAVYLPGRILPKSVMVERQPLLFPENAGRSGVLTDSEIQDAVDRNWLISKDTFQQSALEASSYDIHVGLKGILGGAGGELDLVRTVMELGPGAYGGVISRERVSMPENMCARIGSKRALSYEGVILLTGSIVDPGYEGHLLFGLYNASQRKAYIRFNKKICNIVFERLSKAPEKIVQQDPSLRSGSFPDAFLTQMANMEVLPWMQISERVKQIETITKDIFDLKARYDDVLKPISELTESVRSLTKDVGSLTSQTKSIGEDVEKLNRIVEENSKQITQLTVNLGTVTGSIQSLQERSRGIEEGHRDQEKSVASLQATFGTFKVVAWIFWGILLVVFGALLPKIVDKVFSKPAPPSISMPAQQSPAATPGPTAK